MNKHEAQVMVLTIAVVSVLAGGCRPSLPSTPISPETPSPGGPTTTIRFVALSSQQEYYRELARIFEVANPTVKIQVWDPAELSLPELEFREQLSRLATAADVFMASDQDLVWLRNSGLIQDLQPLMANDPTFEEMDFYTGLLTRFENQGRLWGIPAGVSPRVMLYRPDLFEQAGVDMPRPGWTWDDFLVRAQALTHSDASLPVYGFAERWRYEVDTWIYQHDAALAKLSSGDAGPFFDQPRVQEAINWYLDLVRVHHVMPDADSPDAPGSATTDPIATGRVAMWVDYLINLPAVPTDELDIAPLPRDQIEASLPFVNGYFVSAIAADPQACWRWINYLTHQLPERQVLPVRRSLAESEAYEEMVGKHLIEVYRYILEHDQLALAPRQHDWFIEAYDWLVSEGMINVLKDQMTVTEALDEAQRRALTALGSTVEAESTPIALLVEASPLPPSAITISFFTLAGAEAYPRLARTFQTSHPGIKIQVKTPQRQWSLGDLAQTMDVFQIFGGIGSEAEIDAYFLDLEPLLLLGGSKLDLDDFYPQALDAFRWNGSLRGLPTEIDARMLFYNQDLFDEAGVEYPQSTWTWDDLVDTAVQLTEGEGNSRRYGFISYDGEWVDDVILLAFQRGGHLVDNLTAPTAPTLNDPALVDALRWYADLRWEYDVMPAPFDPFEDLMMQGPALVQEGRAAMWIGDVGSLLPGKHLPFRLGVIPLPVSKEAATVFSVSGYALSPQRPNVEASWEWLQFISRQVDPIDALPARRSLLSQARFSRVPSASRETLKNALLETLSRYQDASYAQVAGMVPWYAEVYQIFTAAAEAVVQQGEDPMVALSNAQQQAVWAVEKYTNP